MKKLISLLLAVTLLLGALPYASAAEPSLANFVTVQNYGGEFADVPAGAWYEQNVALAYELGLVKGKSDTAFEPDSDIQISEALTFACRLHSIYHTGSADFVQGSPWYQVYVDYATAHGIIAEGEYADYSAKATRAQFAQIFANVLPDDAMPYINDIPDGYIPDVTDTMTCRDAVYHLYRAGILTGSDAVGTFKPDTHIIRAEVAAIVTRMALESQRRVFRPIVTLHEGFAGYVDALNLSTDKLSQSTISGVEMTELLDKLVAYAAPEKLAQWQGKYPVLRGSGEPLSRFDAMASLFLAAQCIGGDYTGVIIDPHPVVDTLTHSWDEDYLRWELYGGLGEEIDIGGGVSGYLDRVSYYYNLGRVSICDGEYPFAYDKETNSLRVKDKTTYTEALLAILRTVSTVEAAAMAAIHRILKDSEFYYLDETEALAPYYEMAAERKEAILNSPTEIVKADTFIPGETYTGTAYYVSPNGNDANDGLSPETAWKNILRVNAADLQEGDAVFFERGSVYRLTDDRLRLADYVTYSAYGEGAKPIITLVQENTARPEYWELYHEGENGEKIWRFHEDIGEVGGIIFDDETWATRVHEWPSPEGWQAINIISLDPVSNPVKGDACADIWALEGTGEYRTVEEQLTEDMTFVTRPDTSEVTYPSAFAGWRVYGSLYLRCDAGNPGELYTDIEIISRRETELYGMDGCMVHGEADGYVLDNLSFKWYINNPVAGFLTCSDAIVQNCTAEWGANALLDIVSPDEPTCVYHLVSDGFYNVANNATFLNNYFRQNASAITMEPSDKTPKDLGTLTCVGNLIENCTEGFRITPIFNPTDEQRYNAVILQDNIILDTGTSMNNGNWMTPAAIDLGGADVQWSDNIEVSDNILLGSTMSMFYLPDMTEVQMNIHDNIIAQNRDGVLMNEIASDEFGAYARWHMMADAK